MGHLISFGEINKGTKMLRVIASGRQKLPPSWPHSRARFYEPGSFIHARTLFGFGGGSGDDQKKDGNKASDSGNNKSSSSGSSSSMNSVVPAKLKYGDEAPRYPHTLALPLVSRPLFPGVFTSLTVSDRVRLFCIFCLDSSQFFFTRKAND